MKKMLFAGFLLFTLSVGAQKNVVPVTQSPLTGIPLPATAKLDKRGLSITLSKSLMEIESKTYQTKLKSAEILTMPPEKSGGPGLSLIQQQLTEAGWAVTPCSTKDYYWLYRNNQYVLAYLFFAKKETTLYFAEATQPPANMNFSQQTQQPGMQQQETPIIYQQEQDPQGQMQGQIQEQQQGQGQEQMQGQGQMQEQPVMNNSFTSPFALSKPTTNFDDGWTSTPTTDYVKVTRPGVEIRLYYADDGLEKIRSNTQEPSTFYWNQWVLPQFNIAQAERWSGVEYPVIYFMQGTGVDKQTGQSCHVAIKVIYEGGAQVVMAISQNQSAYQQLFPHPNDLNKMLGYNKFAITESDIIGTWTKNGGGGVEYYNAYTGNYAGMSALSTSDEFVFKTGGNYQSTHNSANTQNGSTQFNGINYAGKFQASDWELHASNRVSGKTKKFLAQFIAVKGGLLLQLTDSDYTPLVYTMYKSK
ncbi:MAG: hypothetical protein SFU20_12745 [Chitinophagaceae bacterium]|nr:hypothetical protein [Chitinophagaceae bacterium]